MHIIVDELKSDKSGDSEEAEVGDEGSVCHSLKSQSQEK